MPPPTAKLDFLSLTQEEFAQPTERRIQRGLEQPVDKSNAGSMQLGAINKISQARIRYAVAELTGMNLDKASAWLDALALDSPAKALELLLELLKFTTPQQKSMTVESTPTETTNFGNLTMKQLQGLVFQAANADGVVSEQ
jgi:hypothetical protein